MTWSPVFSALHEKIPVRGEQILSQNYLRRPLREGPPEYQQIYKGPAGAKFLIFDLIVSNNRPSLVVSKTKISTLSDMPVKNADVYKLYYSWLLVQK